MSALGGICYATGVFQVLAHTPGFLDNLEETGRDFCDDDDSHSMTGVLYWILMKIRKPDKSINFSEDRDVHCFMDAIFKLDKTFRNHLQNDCHSFLISLLSIIKSDNEIYKKNPTSIFEGKLQNGFLYTTCNHEETSEEEVFVSLLVPIFSDDGRNSVQGGLSHLLGEEVFGFDSLKCRKCEKQQKDTITTKQTKITQPPDILILQLARFKEVKLKHRSQSILEKEESPVCFEEVITLDGKERFKYRIYGIIIHLGNLEEGHYITYVKNNTEQAGLEVWLKCDGSDVKKCSRDVVFDWTKTCAYVLFYQRVRP